MNSAAIIQLFQATRSDTEAICSPLEIEDFVVQPVEFVSPPKWHLGHTTWFFEEMVLKKAVKNYREYHPDFGYVFNSYYESVGKRVLRTNRGNLSRPTVSEIKNYRQHVTRALLDFLKNNKNISKEILQIIEIGCHHEKQHQELLLTDIKYILGTNPLFPVYHSKFEENPVQDFSQKWLTVEEGVYEIGHAEKEKFCYDNELGAHKIYLNQFQISNKLVTNREFLEFVENDGYEEALLWHADAWDWVRNEKIKAPFYWHKIDGKWHQYTLAGLKKLPLDAPVSHISYYEAYAFAQWKKMRLPTEGEWETAQNKFEWGSRWEWTESAYLPYPNYQKSPGALGEYNGKFMVNQKVLRGGAVSTADHHLRSTYRNFFHPGLRWQFTGIRLAR